MHDSYWQTELGNIQIGNTYIGIYVSIILLKATTVALIQGGRVIYKMNRTCQNLKKKNFWGPVKKKLAEIEGK